jgi:hypothetical protein
MCTKLTVVPPALLQGESVKVVTIGGSITAGQGCMDTPTWPQFLETMLSQQYGNQTKVCTAQAHTLH